jgi:hypothetical protein
VRRSLVVLAVGGALCTVGFILAQATTYSIGQNAQDQSFPIALLTFDPNEQKSTDLSITETSRPVYLFLTNTDELNNPLVPRPAHIDTLVTDPNEDRVISVSDSVKKAIKVVPTISGKYSIYLTNTDAEEGAQIMIVGTYAEVPTTGQEILDQAGPAVAGVLLIFAGIPTLIVGGILYAIDRRKERRNAMPPST